MTPVRYTFDGARSCVWVNARSNLHPINTETRGLEGWVDVSWRTDGTVDLGAPVNGSLKLAVDRLSSGNQLYDRELKRRVDAKRYPVITGAITGVARTDIVSSYLVSGDLSFHGKTRSFQHPMVISQEDELSLAMTGDYVFDIRQFDMKPPSMLMLKVYPEVAVRVALYGTTTS